MKTVLFSVLCVLSLAACNATYRDGNQSIHVNDGYANGHGNFCPPGQAKKGNC